MPYNILRGVTRDKVKYLEFAIPDVPVLRLPDFYARTHAVGKSETLGTILMLSGLAVYNGWELSTIKILFIVFFVLIANPTATHAIARAALRTGLQPWTRKKKRNSKDRGD